MDFASLFPDIKPWVQSLTQIWPAPIIKGSSWMFPSILCVHVLALTVVGGAMLLPSLRLMGVGMTSVPASTIEKTIRPWLWGALVILAVTGVLMGLVNPMKLYTRPAFFVKAIALVAALVLSLGVVRSAASRDGVFTGNAKIMLGAGLLIWLASVLIFGTAYGAAPGSFHVICAAWLIVMAFGSNLTRIVLGVLTAIAVIAVGFVTYGLYDPLDDYEIVMDINRWALRAAAVVITGFLVWTIVRAPASDVATPRLGRLAGMLTILAWFTVAAAGRWIGLGQSGA
ncbi:MAG TPA: DUF6644 family protein [Hyphomonadaceae bacterium]|nr:DUF6644 family protein [Hyphomonadaceae bacterium]